MSEYEECRTYPASKDHPIWGRRKGDRFHPWFVPSLEANWIGYPLSECGPNVSPDGSVLVEKEDADYGNISPELQQFIDELAARLARTIRETVDRIMAEEA